MPLPGFEGVASGSSDMEKPEKNLPKALPLSIFMIAAIYLGIVFVSMQLNPMALLNSSNVVVLADIFDNPVLQNAIVLGALSLCSVLILRLPSIPPDFWRQWPRTDR